MNLSPQMHIAVRTARSVAKSLTDRFERRYELSPRKKGANDLVSDADTQTETEIIQQLKSAYPGYHILAEESGGRLPPRGYCWIIDPIDGTTNFINGVPHFSFSIALAENGTVIGGLVMDPLRNEVFVGEKGRGAFLNDYRIRVGNKRLLSESLLATGFPRKDKSKLEQYLETFSQLFLNCRGIRRQGSAALDLAYVAAGRYDGFWESGLSRWDIAAGQIILLEAGGFMTDFRGRNQALNTGEVVAANPDVHHQMMTIINPTEERQQKTTLKLNKK
ncbi:MAG: inositol monophosphatase [Magnetococcales bacterium]|nr:inositol monophosphatase [Magnetococcales bacterium]